MNRSTLTCQDEQRRQQVRRQRLNGLDYLEVSDDQRSLCVYFLGPVPENITKSNIQIEGGQRIRDIQVTQLEWERQEDPTLDSCLRVFVDKFGDFLTYILRLIEIDDQGQLHPLSGFDPRYAYLPFTFKIGCPSDLDCKSSPICPPEERIEPEINYLAKDYASFRRLILDRLALIMPAWKERHVPDLGITLIELLAYVGDYLSYYQDAVATEAYLDTARQRISVRRHVRLVDYRMHEGCNARTWVWLETSEDKPLELKDIYCITSYPNAPASGVILTADDLRNISIQQYEVFEPIIAEREPQIQLYQAHNEIHFYTWGDRQCCLPKGTTTATLVDAWIPPSNATPKQLDSPQAPCDDDAQPPPLPKLARQLHLKVGDILIFEEVKGAKTGNRADADPTHRHAVRLTEVRQDVDVLYPLQVQNVPPAMPTPIVEITWAAADALPFALCILAIGLAPDCCLIEDISVVRGNVILVDHGQTIADLPEPTTVLSKETVSQCEGEGQPTEIVNLPGLFRPSLKGAPLTFRQPLFDTALRTEPAVRLLLQDPRQALPQMIKLSNRPGLSHSNSEPENLHWEWTPQLDLLGSTSQDRHFVVEMDGEGRAHLRFGDGELGQMPAAQTHFHAVYRIGNGLSGNIGAETISHVVQRQGLLSGITLSPHNPFPAKGGTSPEPLSEVKLFAPYAFRKELQRAITAQDYADIVMRDFSDRVQRAAATLRWTGSWYEVLVAIDSFGTETTSEELLKAISDRLYRYRRIGHDVVVKPAVYVSLAIAMTVCVQPDYLRGHVEADLLAVFSNRLLPDGQLGFFHPDHLTFGTGIALSQLVAAAKAVTGVENIIVTQLERFGEVNTGELANGILSLSPLEVARLDNDPNFPEHGILKLDMQGGR